MTAAVLAAVQSVVEPDPAIMHKIALARVRQPFAYLDEALSKKVTAKVGSIKATKNKATRQEKSI